MLPIPSAGTRASQLVVPPVVDEMWLLPLTSKVPLTTDREIPDAYKISPLLPLTLRAKGVRAGSLPNFHHSSASFSEEQMSMMMSTADEIRVRVVVR
jgi:hypothetical protein